MMISAIPSDIAHEGCARRVDFGRFTVFVATYVPSGRHYHHGHEDLLSYVIYADGEELLIDPGRPSYSKADPDMVAASMHNGLYAVNQPLCPRPGPFVPAAFGRPSIRQSIDTDRALFEAVNRILGRRRTLVLTHESDERLRLDDTLHLRADSPIHYCAMLGKSGGRLGKDGIEGEGWSISLENIEHLECAPAMRSIDYGRKDVCERLSGRAVDRSATTWVHLV